MRSTSNSGNPSASNNIEKWLSQGTQGGAFPSPSPADVSSPARDIRPQSSPSIASSPGDSFHPSPARLLFNSPGKFSSGSMDPPGGGAARDGHVAAPQASARALSAAFSELKTSSTYTGSGVPSSGYTSAAPSSAGNRETLVGGGNVSQSKYQQTSAGARGPYGSPTAAAADSGRYSDTAHYSEGAATYKSPVSPRPGYSPPKYGQAPESIHSQGRGHENAGGGLGSFKNSFKGTVPSEGAPGKSSGNERLYEAYNELHSLAQVFKKPFDAPAILIVGHQTDGKSALVEALMGFQFNHVGGGTKTRRPITLQMSYNAHRHEPRCFLVLDKDLGREEQKTLPQLQAYIERENQRLEAEGGRFGEKEIVIRVEYKYCPNLTIIDTPGLISAAPGRSHSTLQEQAATVESLVMAKMQQREFVILCLEDSNDWNNATTRRIVMAVDPDLSRTIIVSTKLDTKIPQFSRAADVQMFLTPSIPGLPSSRVGNRPFFSSVPSGRVGNGVDCVFASDEHFREAVLAREQADVVALEAKMGRPLTEDERSRVGVSKLRLFLEQLLQHRYLESVPFIVPLLDGELRSINNKLGAAQKELRSLSEPQLREMSRDFRDKFMAQLSLLLRGTIAAPPQTFGETLEDERARGGAFLGEGGQQLPVRNMPNAGMRLFGGAQYHRAMAEFRFVAGSVAAPSVSREEIVNSCGVEDFHDGTNYYRTACVIAVKKALDIFEPYLRQLGMRLSHVVRRLFPIVLYLLQKEKEPMLQHDLFLDHVASSFAGFVDATESSCIDRCIEDLTSTTRFVSWTLHQKNRADFQSLMENSMSPLQMPGAPGMGMGSMGMSPEKTPTPPHSTTKKGFSGAGAGAGAGAGGGEDTAPAGAGQGPSGLVKLLSQQHSNGNNSTSPDARGGASASTAGREGGDGRKGVQGGAGGASQLSTPLSGPQAHLSSGTGSTPEVGAGMRTPPPSEGGAPGAHQGAPPARLADVLEGSLWTKRLAPSSEDMVNNLVARIFCGVRDHFVLSAELKFNCFFLMPLLDKYPARLREDLEAVAGGDADSVFDLSRTRNLLLTQEKELQEELARMQSLQTKFSAIHSKLKAGATPI